MVKWFASCFNWSSKLIFYISSFFIPSNDTFQQTIFYNSFNIYHYNIITHHPLDQQLKLTTFISSVYYHYSIAQNSQLHHLPFYTLLSSLNYISAHQSLIIRVTFNTNLNHTIIITTITTITLSRNAFGANLQQTTQE